MNQSKQNRTFLLLFLLLLFLLSASVASLFLVKPHAKVHSTDFEFAVGLASFEHGADFNALSEVDDLWTFYRQPNGLEMLSKSNLVSKQKNFFYHTDNRLDWNLESITDCEVVCIRWKNSEKTVTVYALYDFVSHKDYLVLNGDLFRSLDSEVIGDFVDIPEYHRFVENVEEAEYNRQRYFKGIFRYERFFHTDRHEEAAVFSGLKNKTPQEPLTNEQRIELALAELDFPTPLVQGMYYDEHTGYYLIRVAEGPPRMLPWTRVRVFTEGNGAEVIMDANGVTKETLFSNVAFYPDWLEYDER